MRHKPHILWLTVDADAETADDDDDDDSPVSPLNPLGLVCYSLREDCKDSVVFLADRTATQYDRLLGSSCHPSVRLSVRDALRCGCQGWCTGLNVVPACS